MKVFHSSHDDRACFSSPTCQQKPLRLIDVDGKVGVLIMVPFVLLHWLCHSHIPQLNLHINEENAQRKWTAFI